MGRRQPSDRGRCVVPSGPSVQGSYLVAVTTGELCRWRVLFLFRLFKDRGQVKLPPCSISWDMPESPRVSFLRPLLAELCRSLDQQNVGLDPAASAEHTKGPRARWIWVLLWFNLPNAPLLLNIFSPVRQWLVLHWQSESH